MQNATVVVINAGTSETSSTAMLLSQIAKSVQETGENITCTSINVRDVAQDAMTALVSGHKSAALQEIEATLLNADALIVGTPVFKAGASAVFMAFFQALDNDLLIGTPVLLAGTAGSQRHALVVDDQIRGLFAYLRTYTTPTSVFAAPEDFNDPKLRTRSARAAGELLALVRADVRGGARNNTWDHYQHSYGSAGDTELSIDLDSDLMRLATGNSYNEG